MILGVKSNSKDSNSGNENKRHDSSQEEYKAFSREPPDWKNRAINFDWANKWLKGDEYYHILANAALYCSTYEFEVFPSKTHPKSTYEDPKSKHFRSKN